MIQLYFGSLFSILTTILVLGMLCYIIWAFLGRRRIQKWGRLVALFLMVGTAISAFSATRDAYAAPGALFAMNSPQSLLCSVAGGLIFLTAFVTIFFRRQGMRRVSFFLMSAFFLLQVVVIEASRLVLSW